jgi:hypothetical protein
MEGWALYCELLTSRPKGVRFRRRKRTSSLPPSGNRINQQSTDPRNDGACCRFVLSVDGAEPLASAPRTLSKSELSELH